MSTLTAYNNINAVVETLTNVRINADEHFGKFYERMKNNLKIPQIASHQTLRNNTPTSSLQEYFRRTIFLQLLDGLISQTKERYYLNVLLFYN